VNLGYRWATAPGFALGVEGGYVDLGKWSNDQLNAAVNYPGSDIFPDAKVKGWTAGVNTHWNLGDNWYVSGRTGIFRADVQGWYAIERTFIGTGVPYSELTGLKDKTTRWYAGAGVGHDFSSRFSVGLNYDYYKARKDGLKFSPNLVSVSAEVRF
jgi:predicted porin